MCSDNDNNNNDTKHIYTYYIYIYIYIYIYNRSGGVQEVPQVNLLADTDGPYDVGASSGGADGRCGDTSVFDPLRSSIRSARFACRSWLHPVCNPRFGSFRTQPLEILCADSVRISLKPNPTLGTILDSEFLLCEVGVVYSVAREDL